MTKRDDDKFLNNETVMCHLCDKPILKTDNASVGLQSGTMIHMDCHLTWLKEKIKGKNT